MKKVGKRLIGSLFTVLLFCVMISQNVMAAGSVSITASAETVEVGGEVSVTIKAENPEGSAEKPEISVEYDAAVLSFESCDKENSYGGGGGGLITLSDTEATITFKGAASGTTDVKVSAVLDGDGANVPTDQVTVAVGDGVNAAPAGGEAATTSNIADGLIAINGTEKMLSTTFPNEIIPAGFHKADFTYQEQMLESAQFDMGDLTLLYVTDAGGANGEFCIYDQATDTFIDFVSINGIESKYIIIMIPDESVVVPDGFIKATLQWNGKTLQAYAINGAIPASSDTAAEGTADGAAESEAEGVPETTANGVNTSDFFLLYALNSDGNQGWYMYDMKEGTYQRYLQLDASAAEEPSVLDVFDSDTDSYKAQSHTRFIVICVMAVVILILIILLVNLFLKLRDYQSYEYIDEDEEDEDEEDTRDNRYNSRNGRGSERLSADEIRARRYEAGEDLEETGEIYLEQPPVRQGQAYQQAAPVSPVGYETQDMVFEDISLPEPLPDEDEDEEEDRRGRKKNKKKKSRLAKWYEEDDFGDDDMDEDDEDDEDDDEDDDYTERHSFFGRKKKKAPEPVEATQLDWSEMQSAMQGADEDERRPLTGTRRPVTAPKMTVTEPPTEPHVRTMRAPGAVPPVEAPHVPHAEPPVEPIAKPLSQPVQRQPVQQPPRQPAPRTQYEQPVQPQYEQPVHSAQQPYYEQPVQQPRYEQPMSQPYYEQPMQQPQYEAPVQQPYYGQQIQQPYYEQPIQQSQYAQSVQQPIQQPQYNQPVQQPYYEQPVQPAQQPKLDLDDDFEFEFIDVDK